MLKFIVSLVAVAFVFVLHTGDAEANCGTAQKYSANTWQSCNTDVSFGGNYSGGCYGRCGPACSWTWMGNVYTTACKSHDWCVRDTLAKGKSQLYSHGNCVGILGVAAASWYVTKVVNHWHSWLGKIRDKVTGFVSNPLKK